MMEQYLDGPEVDVDVVLNAEGDVVYGNVTDNWPTIEPYFNETGKPLLAMTGEVPRFRTELWWSLAPDMRPQVTPAQAQ